MKLNNVILYAKNWYIKSDNIIIDLQKMLTMDGYIGEYFSTKDICYKLYNHLKEIKDVSNIIFDIEEDNCWKFGYWTKNNGRSDNFKLPKYNHHMAIIYVCLSHLRLLSRNEYSDTLFPPNTSLHPLKNGLKNKQVEQIFGVDWQNFYIKQQNLKRYKNGK